MNGYGILISERLIFDSSEFSELFIS